MPKAEDHSKGAGRTRVSNCPMPSKTMLQHARVGLPWTNQLSGVWFWIQSILIV